MTHYLKNGNSFKPVDEAELDLHQVLPAKNYIIKEDQYGNLYLEQVDSFVINYRLYGNNPNYTKRIINTFLDRPNSTGVLLTGEKGSGKTLLVKTLSIELSKLDIPTIIINSPLYGDKFNKFIQDIEQPCLICWDEFEKVYSEDEQQAILTLLDGVFPSKKLFVLTSNDKWQIDQHMRNRPGRIYYAIDFVGVDPEFIIEYCNDNLKYPEHINQICKIATMFSEFNFDMLKALVEEINRYGETPQEAIKLLNTKPEHNNRSRYNVELTVDGDIIKTSPWSGNPLSEQIDIGYSDDKDEYCVACFTHQHIRELNATTGKFVFVNQLNQQLVLSKIFDVPFNYFDAF